MTAQLVFDYPQAWQLGGPMVLFLMFLKLRALRRQELSRGQISTLLLLRLIPLLLLVFLSGRPSWLTREPPRPATRSVVVLVDRSESMSLEEDRSTRYQEALAWLRDRLLPALRTSGYGLKAYAFAQDAERVEGSRLASLVPNGKRTSLATAIARSLSESELPPEAVIALTDGAVNENQDNPRALAALMESRAPFIGIGFGSDLGVRTLNLRQVEAPASVAPQTVFSLTAQMEAANAEEIPPFDLVLYRDGKFAQKKTIQTGKGSRCWVESFTLTEKEIGLRNYSVQFLPPAVPGLKCINSTGAAAVHIANEKEMRLLYVQGSLTWDYKFVGLALRGDPAIKLTGITRTSQQSIFRQNIENASELQRGIPETLEELAAFRVVVLANLKPSDLKPAQQELLARFCGELGGGVLMIGGPATFDASWQGSRLEQLLPVVFAPGMAGLQPERSFRMVLTDEALQHPVFQVADQRAAREVWAQLPTFSQYGRVDSAKPGAQIWAYHQNDSGPQGKRILMAAQRYGAGRSAIICVQNFWRWRLARQSETGQYDRFWRQLFRFLGEASRQNIAIHMADQDLHPGMDVRLVLERTPSPDRVTETSHKFLARVEYLANLVQPDQTLELPPATSIDMSFPAQKAGLYTITVFDLNKQPVASRTLEIRDINVEFQNTARNLETLRQWAALSHGLAIKAEDCRDGQQLLKNIQIQADEARQSKPWREPAGANGGMLAVILSLLSLEWILRKRWRLA